MHHLDVLAAIGSLAMALIEFRRVQAGKGNRWWVVGYIGLAAVLTAYWIVGSFSPQ